MISISILEHFSKQDTSPQKNYASIAKYDVARRAFQECTTGPLRLEILQVGHIFAVSFISDEKVANNSKFERSWHYLPKITQPREKEDTPFQHIRQCALYSLLLFSMVWQRY